MRVYLKTSIIQAMVETINSCMEAIEAEEDPDELVQAFEELSSAAHRLSGVAEAELERLSSILDAIA